MADEGVSGLLMRVDSIAKRCDALERADAAERISAPARKTSEYVGPKDPKEIEKILARRGARNDAKTPNFDVLNEAERAAREAYKQAEREKARTGSVWARNEFTYRNYSLRSPEGQQLKSSRDEFDKAVADFKEATKLLRSARGALERAQKVSSAY